MRTSRMLAAAAVALTLCFGGGHALAAIVDPGGVVTDPPGDSPTPVGTLVDEDVRSVTFTYIPPTGFGFIDGVTPSADVTFRSQVYRDPATQRLSFVYSWEDQPGTFGEEGGTMTVTSFADFTTDVSGNLGGLESTIRRSADGATLEATGAGSGQGTVEMLLVATNATEYDQGGTLTMDIFDAFTFVNLDNPDDLFTDQAGAQASLAGTFQPVADDGGGGGGGGTPIPLPAGVWGGLAMLSGTGLAGSLRRRLARRHA